MENNVIGSRIKDLRKSRKMTLKDLGERIGVQGSVVARYEKGQVTNLKRATIRKIADVFDVSPLYIMGIDEQDATDKQQLVIDLVKKLDDKQCELVYSLVKQIYGD